MKKVMADSTRQNCSGFSSFFKRGLVKILYVIAEGLTNLVSTQPKLSESFSMYKFNMYKKYLLFKGRATYGTGVDPSCFGPPNPPKLAPSTRIM